MPALKTRIAALCLAGLIAASPCAAEQSCLSGVVRQFGGGDVSAGHPLFGSPATSAERGPRRALLGPFLSDDRKPRFRSGLSSQAPASHSEALHGWFHDVPGVNVSVPFILTLARQAIPDAPVYRYGSARFFPGDGRLPGDERLLARHHFTVELHGGFTYRPGQYLSLHRDDDAWVFVNGRCVLDMGGMHPPLDGRIVLLDGKAFAPADLSPEGAKVVDEPALEILRRRWRNLQLEGECPVPAGWVAIDLNLTGGVPDTRAEFHGRSRVRVYAAEDIEAVVLKFADGRQQRHERLEVGTMAELEGRGADRDRVVAGVWVRCAGEGAGRTGQFHARSGASSIGCSLSLFMANRGEAESVLAVETNMRMEPLAASTISPLYD